MNSISKKFYNNLLLRSLELVKTLQFAWFGGHCLVLFTSLLYFLAARKNIKTHDALYRIFYTCVLETFSIIVYQQHFKGRNVNINRFITDDNFIYALITLFWLLTPRFTFTMIPFIIFSLFHFLTYIHSVLLPTIFHFEEKDPYVQLISEFVRNNRDQSLVWSSNSEIFCFIIVTLRAISWKQRSWTTFIVYGLFIKLRYEKSKYMRNCIRKWEVRVDGLVSHPSVPSQLKYLYATLKRQLDNFGTIQLLTSNEHKSE